MGMTLYQKNLCKGEKEAKKALVIVVFLSGP
jgi:hypothetical protein